LGQLARSPDLPALVEHTENPAGQQKHKHRRKKLRQKLNQ
jgi:hypothetical protein